MIFMATKKVGQLIFPPPLLLLLLDLGSGMDKSQDPGSNLRICNTRYGTGFSRANVCVAVIVMYTKYSTVLYTITTLLLEYALPFAQYVLITMNAKKTFTV
jgi:hypothetical protein